MSILSLNPKLCTGCTACMNACPESAISMTMDVEGFLFPKVSSACVECGLCEQCCPSLNQGKLKVNMPESGVLAIGLDKHKISGSASGGAFSIFASYIISEKYGAAVGACMDKNLRIRHEVAENVADIESMKGSKYVQSDIADAYLKTKQLLKKGRRVLFSGTPCQIAGIKSFLMSDYPNLITIDIVCHGVSAPGAFEQYVRFLGEKGEVTAFRFRNHTPFDRAGFITRTDYVSKRGKHTTTYHHAKDDVYFRFYLDGKVFRNSCYVCPYAKGERIGDITIGDCNTIDHYPAFHPREGTSIILLNTERGKAFWEETANLFDSTVLDVQKELSKNGQLHEPSAIPEDRDHCCACFSQGDFRSLKIELRAVDSSTQKIRRWLQLRVPFWYRSKIGRVLRRIKLLKEK